TKSKYMQILNFEPNHALAMSLGNKIGKCFSLSEDSALEYLKGYQLKYENRLMVYGWMPAAYMGYTLGWCKLTENAAKNHLPKGLRIT
ncbi:MAG: hypothetical protein K2N14_00010, partial [Clostridia bacterium]|nr:hypothetical protein [Clostridia bacterium]